jgi:spore coat polysaccharide biosynthesis protein SpsF
MGSERLKGKVLKTILEKPIILHVLDRVSKSKKIDKVILATSTNPENDILAEVVSNAGYEVFRGSEDNVLKRYYDLSKKVKADTIIRVTGDCPLIEPDLIDKLISFYNSSNYDYARLDVPNTVFRGIDAEILSFAAIEKTIKEATESKYLEHVTYYIYTHQDKFNVGILKGDNTYNKNYRLCVDTNEDFNLVKTVFKEFNDEYVHINKIINFLDNNPEIASININIEQKHI